MGNSAATPEVLVKARRQGLGTPIWQLAVFAAVLVLALAFVAWSMRPPSTEPVAVEPSPTATPAATATPVATPTGAPIERALIYLSDPATGLPRAVSAAGGGVSPTPTDAAGRIRWRLMKLGERYPESGVPATATVRSVEVAGDLVTIDYDTTSTFREVWEGFSSAETLKAVQEIVYTATEEPGIRRALIRENGEPATIGSALITTPLAREDVFGYAFAAKTGFTNGITDDGSGEPVATARIEMSVDTAVPGLARVTVRTLGADGNAVRLPRWGVWLEEWPAADPAQLGKYVLIVDLRSGTPFGSDRVEIVDRTPLRAMRTVGGTVLQLALDDARPWRAWVSVDATALTIDIGGIPQAVSDRIAVYAPAPAAFIARTFTLSGASRTFEANVVWRVEVRAQTVLQGFTTASAGTSPVWGTFSTEVTLPPNIEGNLTIVVYESSAKDGSELGKVGIPVTVR